MRVEIKQEESGGKPTIALYINGDFVCSYLHDSLPDARTMHIWRGFINAAVGVGERQRAKAISELLRG